MKKFFEKNQAITLVSLVVTIIILIILAGVSINLILGEKGIITIAKQAKENTELAKIEEETRLNELYMQIEAEDTGLGEISYDAIAKLVEFKREIASAITDMGITTSESADASTMADNIRNISGASSADKVSYNNTNSGLASTNVQGAIDEVNNSLEETKQSLSDKVDKSKFINLLEQSTTVGSTTTTLTLKNEYSKYAFLLITYSTADTKYSVIIPNYINYNSVAVANTHTFTFEYFADTTKMKVRCSSNVTINAVFGLGAF